MAILPGERDLASFTEAKDGGGDNWSYKTWKAPVKSSPLTNQHPMFCRLSLSQQCQSTEGKM